LPWIEAIVGLIGALFVGAFAFGKWIYDKALDAEKQSARLAAESADKRADFLEVQLQAAQDGEREALARVAATSQKTPETVQEAMSAAIMTLRAENALLKESLSQYRTALHARELELSTSKADRAASVDRVSQAELDIRQLEAHIQTLEQQLEIRNKKTAQAEELLSLVVQGYFSEEIIHGMTATIYAQADAARQRVRAAQTIEKMATERVRRDRNTAARFAEQERALEQAERSAASSVYRKMQVPIPHESKGPASSSHPLADDTCTSGSDA
jgi:hypothetical protein